MKKILEKNIRSPKTGEIIEGKIIGIGRSALYLDLGIIGTGVIYGREFKEAKDTLKDLKIGEKLFAKITELENEEGFFELSATQADKEMTWKILKEKKEKEEIVKVKILGANKGGLLAKISNIQAFLPVSQLSLEHYPRVKEANQSKIMEALQKFVGKELEVKIFDISKKEEKLILSEKAKDAEKTKKLLENYKTGDIVEGKITGIVDFGVFVKFGPEKLEGLIHISELDWELIESPSKVAKIGEEVKVKIINISKDKVFLSLKALKKNPWEDIGKKYKKDNIVKGKVVKLNPFGAFVRLSSNDDNKKKDAGGSKIQGLCHISEFGTREKMEKELEIGKKYDFKILFIEPKEQKIALKLIK